MKRIVIAVAALALLLPAGASASVQDGGGQGANGSGSCRPSNWGAVSTYWPAVCSSDGWWRHLNTGEVVGD